MAWSGFTFGGKPYNPIGANDADNVFDSSAVVANNDGSVLERLEHITTVLSGLEPVTFTPSSAPTVDEDGGREAIHVSIVDRNTGPIASGSIDITGITYELAKSTAGGAFSTVGITQPAGATKADGELDLEFDIVPGEWQAGDTYRLKVGTVTATVGATTYHMGTLVWVGEVVEDLDLKTTVDDINTDLGEPTDATTDTVHGKLGTDAEMADNSLFDLIGGAEIVTPAVTGNRDGDLRDRVDAIANALGVVDAGAGGGFEEDGTPSVYDRVTGDADSLENRIGNPTGGTATTLTARIGDVGDAAVDPDGGVGSLHAKVAGVGDLHEVPVVDSNDNVHIRDVVGQKGDAGVQDPTDLTASLVALSRGLHEEVGANSEAATAPEAGSGTVFSKLRGVGEDTRWIANADPGAATAGSLAARIGELADVASEAGSVHAKLASVLGDVDTIRDTATTVTPVADSIEDELDRILSATSGTDGVADNGSATTLIDAARTEATADHWRGMLLKMTTGANAGLSRPILDFDPATDTFTVAPAFPQLIATGDEYSILPIADALIAHLALNATGLTIETNSLADQHYIGAGEQLRTFIAKTGGTPVAAGKSVVNALGHDGTTDLDTGLMGQLQDYVVDDAASIYNRLGDPTSDTLSTLTAKLGDNDDAPTDPSAASGNVLSKLRGAGDNLDTIIAELANGTYGLAALETLVDDLESRLTATRAGYLDQYWRLDPDPVTAIADATVGSGAEENLLDLGADAGTTAYRLDSALCNVASLGTNTEIRFRLKSEINGTLTQIGNDVVRTGTGAFDLMSVLGVTNFASRHIRVTVVGDNAANDGSVAATFVTSLGGI